MHPLLLSLAVWAFSPAGGRAREAGADSEPRTLIRRAIKAHGGDRLTRLRLVREQARGSLTVLGMKVPFTQETLLRTPNQFRVSQNWEARGKKVSVVQIFDGNKGWLTEAGVPRAADAGTLANWKELAHANRVATLTPLLAADKGFELAPLGEIEVKGRKAVGVKVSYQGRRDVRLYFDRETGLLVQKSFQPRAGGKETVQDEIYSDFKEVEGLKRPTRVSVLLGGVPQADVEIIATRFPERVDDKEFSKP